MTVDAAKGRKTADNRQESRRLRPVPALAGALVLATALAPLAVTEAAAQSRSGIYINNDVLNNLGPGPEAAPYAPLAPSAAPSYQPSYQAPAAPPAAGGGSLGFQPYGSGNFVVTRPGTLLFPPLHEPDSTLTPGFAQPDNHAARARALDNAFAEGPEPSSQLLIPLDAPAAGNDGGDSVIVFMDALPPADPDVDASAAPRLVLRQPPQPAPRKPEVPAETLADVRQRMPEEPAELAPEFAAPEPTEVADLPPAEPDTPAAAEMAASEPIAEEAPASAPEAPAVATARTETSDGTGAVASEMPSAETVVAETPVAEAPRAEAQPAEMAQAETPVAAAPASMTPLAETSASDAPEATSPVSLLPAASDAAARVQTASLAVGGFEDTSLLFDTDSAELSPEAQTELRSIADVLRVSEDGEIQVLGFAAGSDGAEDQARKLALSRALKVRSFLIDEGIASARIRVRSLGASAEGGPANRVDIRPIGS